MALTVLSDRQSSVTVLHELFSDIDGDQAKALTLPSGFGDCAILHVGVWVAAVATMRANPEIAGPSLILLTPGATANLDPVGEARWVQFSATAVQASVEPYRPVYWQQQEELGMYFAEVDTNATPTADLRVFIRVRRLRDLSPGERQLYLRGMFGF